MFHLKITSKYIHTHTHTHYDCRLSRHYTIFIRWNITYKPYQKPENILHSQKSNHPPYIIKQIPITIETLLWNHSSNETVFRHAAQDYEKALKKSGYNVKLQYKPTKQDP